MAIVPYILTRFGRAGLQMRYLPRTLELIWDAAGKWTIAWATLLVVQGLLPILTVLLTRTVVDQAALVFRTGGDAGALRSAAVPALAMASILVLAEILKSVAHWVRTAQTELVQGHIRSLIQRQSSVADLAFYETPDFFDHLHRARAEASYRPLMLLESVGSLLQGGITLLGMAALLVPFGWWLPVALCVSTLPAFYVVLRHAIRQHQWRLRTTEDERRAEYFDWLLSSREAAAELRLFGLGEYFQSSYRSIWGRLSRERIGLARDQSMAELAAGMAGLALSAGSLAWMVWQAVLGAISLGDLAMFYQAFQRGLELMRVLLQNAGQTYGNLLYLGNLFEFLDLTPTVVSPPAPLPVPVALRDGLRFEKVHFRYPKSEMAALAGLDVFIPAGKIVAIVGPNGSGKSTLVKLLCRFYDPDAGSITMDGIDLRGMDIAELRRRMTVLFQQPVHHNATVRENIGLGDIRGTADSALIEAAAVAAGADGAVEKLPQGYDTFLGKWFKDGEELSLGQWQRIALARAILRRVPLSLLDEPTSAMDPWAEADWLARFRQASAGQTAVVITHRFTTAMLADEIHVMDSGRIVESGTHDELVLRGGVYADWWKAQGIG